MLVLVGPSASGKTQITAKLIKDFGLKKLVTYTSRKPRTGEVDGIDYHFVSVEEFEEKIKNNFFFEYVEYNKNYYGTAKNDITDDSVVILEPNGVKYYLENAPELVKVCYIRCPKEILRIRMIERGDEDESIKLRLAKDDFIFNKEIRSLANWMIDTGASNIAANAKEVYDLYEKSLSKWI